MSTRPLSEEPNNHPPSAPVVGRPAFDAVPLPEILRHSPVEVVFGAGRLAELGRRAAGLGAQHALLVTDPGIIAAGHVARAVASLQAAGITVLLFDGARENPTTEHVAAGVAAVLNAARALAGGPARSAPQADFPGEDRAGALGTETPAVRSSKILSVGTTDMTASCATAAGIDLIVGLGGGSAMDCAKGINLILTNGGEIADYWGVDKATRPLLPMIAVPTTAGTGSEAQSFALICDPYTHRKMACGVRALPAAGGLRPRIAILDPELTASQPPDVAAAVGIDAVAHCVETAGCRVRTEISRAFSREAWRLIEPNFERAVVAARGGAARPPSNLSPTTPGAAFSASAEVCFDSTEAVPEPGILHSGAVADAASNPSSASAHAKPEPSDVEARGDSAGRASGGQTSTQPSIDETSDPSDAAVRAAMLLGAHLAGAAIEHAMLGAAHACANPLTACFGVVHGRAVGLMLPHVVRLNARRSGSNPYADLGLDAQALAARIERMLDAANLARRLPEYKIPRAALADLAEMAAAEWTASFNPVDLTAADLLEIYIAAYAV